MSNYYGQVYSLLCDTRGVMQAYTQQMNTLLGSGFQCRGGVWLTKKMGAMVSAFQKIDDQLCAAAKAASAMDADSFSPSSMRWNISQGVKSSTTIRMDYGSIDDVAAALQVIVKNLAAQSAACGRVINTLSAAQYHGKKMPVLLAAVAQMERERLRERAFQLARSEALSELSAASKMIVQTSRDGDMHISEIQRVKSAFAAADQKVRKQMSEYNAKQAIVESKAYTKASNSKQRAAVQAQVTKLEAIQTEYKATHGGKANAELKKEITRLNKLLCWATPILSVTKDKSKGGDVGKTASEVGLAGMGAWCDAYVLKLLRKAGREDVADKLGRGCTNQIARLKEGEGGTWVPASNKSYKPRTGDLVYFGGSDTDCSHVGMFVVKDNGEVWVLHGNFCGAVAFTRWSTPASELVEPIFMVNGVYEQRHDLKAFTVGYGVIN